MKDTHMHTLWKKKPEIFIQNADILRDDSGRINTVLIQVCIVGENMNFY
jgi:hypothetical protein